MIIVLLLFHIVVFILLSHCWLINVYRNAIAFIAVVVFVGVVVVVIIVVNAVVEALLVFTIHSICGQ